MTTSAKKTTTVSSSAQQLVETPLAEKYSPYVKEITTKLRSVGIVFVITAALGFIYYQKILMFLIGLFQLEGINLVLTSPYQFLDLAVQTALVTGTFTTFPLLIFHLVQFAKPALQDTEYKLLTKLLPISMVLFIIGFCFGVWVIQFVITLFTDTTSQLSLSNIWDISHFFSQIFVTGLCLAAVFQMPVVLTTALKLKLVSMPEVKNKRRYIYAAIFIFAALMPPTDIISLSLLTIVPLFLFESALLLN